jgi:hypothetical protein
MLFQMFIEMIILSFVLFYVSIIAAHQKEKKIGALSLSLNRLGYANPLVTETSIASGDMIGGARARYHFWLIRSPPTTTSQMR